MCAPRKKGDLTTCLCSRTLTEDKHADRHEEQQNLLEGGVRIDTNMAHSKNADHRNNQAVESRKLLLLIHHVPKFQPLQQSTDSPSNEQQTFYNRNYKPEKNTRSRYQALEIQLSTFLPASRQEASPISSMRSFLTDGRPREHSKSVISRVTTGRTPFRVLITLLITHLLSPLHGPPSSNQRSRFRADGFRTL